MGRNVLIGWRLGPTGLQKGNGGQMGEPARYLQDSKHRLHTLHRPLNGHKTTTSRLKSPVCEHYQKYLLNVRSYLCQCASAWIRPPCLSAWSAYVWEIERVYRTHGSSGACSEGNDKLVELPAPLGPRVTGKTHEHKGGSITRTHTHKYTHTQVRPKTKNPAKRVLNAPPQECCVFFSGCQASDFCSL